MADIKIAVIHRSTVLTDDEACAAVPALQTQVSRDFAPAWGVDADLRFVGAGAFAGPGHWWLVILDDPDHAGALGYRALTDQGLPLGKVFAAGNRRWTVDASRALLGLLADPHLDLPGLARGDDPPGAVYAYEVCDPCTAEGYAYEIDGTLVSDFVFPAWFDPTRPPGSTRFDFLDRMRNPLELPAGARAGGFDARGGGGGPFVL